MTTLTEQRQHETVVRMRAMADTLHGEAIVEDDLMSGKFRWASAEFLKRTGYTVDTLSEHTIFSLLPEHFHAELRQRLGGKRSKYFMIPLSASNQDVTWWFARDVEEAYPIHWAQARHLTTTPATGERFDMMLLLTEITNASGEIFHSHEEVHDWVKDEIGRLETSDSEARRKLTTLESQMATLERAVNQASSAARESANASLRTSNEVQKLSEQHKGLETRVSTEILRLIGTDALYEKQFDDFKAQLSTATSRATSSIQAAAQDAGKTISFKVSFPVGVVGGVAVILDYVLNHPELIVKVLHVFGLGG